MPKKLQVKQTKSTIGRIQSQKRTIRALGLRRIGHSVVHSDTPSIRGMIETVKELVTVEEIQGE